jgi:hypothetical protein
VREPRGFAGCRGANGIEVAQVDPQDLAVKVKDGGVRLVLGAGRDPAVDGEVSEERLDLGGGEVFGLAPGGRGPGEVDELFDPGEVGALGAEAEALDAHQMADIVEKSHGGILPQSNKGSSRRTSGGERRGREQVPARKRRDGCSRL